MQSILIIRLSSLGDILLSTPLVKELRRAYPDAKIDFLVRSEYVDIVRQFPWISDVIILNTQNGKAEIARVNEELQHRNYDHILDLQNNIRSRMLRKSLKGRLHIINKRTFKRWLLVKFKINRLRNDPDIIGRYFETVVELGISDNTEGASLDRIKHFPSSRIVALCPGARHWNKRWPPEYFVEVAKAIIANGYHVRLYGSSEEKEYVKSIASNLPQNMVTNLCGVLGIAELPGSLEECSLAITNDSGLMHVATSLGIPTMAIFGPTVREFGFYPRATNAVVLENITLDCRPCTTIGLGNCPKGHFNCMNEIKPEDVAVVVEKLLS